MPRVKVLYHDNCFDGAASAALFSHFYRDQIAGDAEFVFVGKSHGTGNVYPPHSFDGDVNAVLDFRYAADPHLDWWFDHHVSAFPTPEDEEHFRAHPSPQKFFDPTARSCTKYLAEMCRQHFGWSYGAHQELVDWADLIDGAQFPSPKAAVELAEPALQLMTFVEHNHDPALKLRFIDELGRRPLAAIAAEPYVKAALAPILAAHHENIELIRSRARYDQGVVSFDVSGDGPDAYNKFIPYFLYPDCHYVVGVSLSATRAKVSVGSNPWAAKRRTVNIAEVCERYGGGGHPVVGAVSLPTEELPRARLIGEEIAGVLRQAAPRER